MAGKNNSIEIPLPRIPQNLTPLLVIALVIAAFAVGALWQKVNFLEKGGVPVAGAPQQAAQPGAAAPSNPTTPVKADTLNIAPISNSDHVRGNKNADLTWIEYSDLQCPFCKNIHPDLVKLQSEYDGKLSWVYRHFPLSSIHQRAQKAAEASECVAKSAGNDAFWKFIDAVFAGDQAASLEDAGLVKAATVAGANGGAVQTCITSGEMASKVQGDYDSGSKSGITGTPGGFIIDKKGNAWVINGAMPYASLKQVVDAALAN